MDGKVLSLTMGVGCEAKSVLEISVFSLKFIITLLSINKSRNQINFCAITKFL